MDIANRARAALHKGDVPVKERKYEIILIAYSDVVVARYVKTFSSQIAVKERCRVLNMELDREAFPALWMVHLNPRHEQA